MAAPIVRAGAAVKNTVWDEAQGKWVAQMASSGTGSDVNVTNAYIVTHNMVWDTGTLAWVEMEQAGAGGGGAVTVADGADVALGATTDAEAVANGSVVAILKRVRTLLGGTLAVSGPVTDAQLRASAVPVSAASLPLPTGASTAAKQPALGTAGAASTDVITVQGIASGTVIPVSDGGGALTVDGTVAVSGSVAVTGPLTDTQLRATAVPVSLASVPSHAVTNAGTFAVQAASAGDVAHDAADSGNPVKVGGKAVSAEPTPVTANDRANFLTDLVGKLITLPYANPENFVSGAITTAMTGTTSTSLVAAPAAGLRNYITTIIVSNAHATVGTDIVIQDGSGGTTLLTIPAAAVYGGAVINLPVPLRQPTTATAIFCANVTTGASTKVSAVGYKGA